MSSVSGRSAGFTIGKMFTFEAGHRLNLGPDHKCSRPHGHSYRVEVILTSGELVKPGFVTDFGDLEPFGRYLKEELDHRMLNDVVEFEPTSELLAGHLAQWIMTHLEPGIPGRLKAVRVSEDERERAAQVAIEHRGSAASGGGFARA